MMNRKRTSYIIVAMAVIIIMAVTSCKPTVPRKYIQPDEMEGILYDYYISQALANHGTDYETSSFNKNVYYNAVLKKHGVTEAEFDSSLVYYYTNSNRFFDIYKKLSERIGNDAAGLGASVGEINKYSQLKADGDTANIWHDATSVVLSPVSPYNKMVFHIIADSTFRRGDSFLLNFMTDFMYQAGTKDAMVYIAVHYKNDSISTHINRVSVSGVSQLRVPSNMDSDIKSIDGFIYLSTGNDESKTLKLMFISQLQFVRFHTTEQLRPDVMRNDTLKTNKNSDTIPESKMISTKSRPDTAIKMRLVKEQYAGRQ